MDETQLLKRFTDHAPGFLHMLGASFVAADGETARCTMQFDIGHDFCHSVDVVQGGFVTAMLDAAMTHAAFATSADVVNISSLEIKTTYLEPTRAGRPKDINPYIQFRPDRCISCARCTSAAWRRAS